MDYFDFLDGKYEVSRLLTPHNEHKILTSRLLFFIDALYFRMSGAILIAVIYGTLALIGGCIAFIAAGRNVAAGIVGALILLGLFWGVAQWENLSWGFQTQFPLMHLFALLSLQCLAGAMTAQNNRIAWLVLACALDFLSIFSLGSGMLVGGGAIALAVWLRRVDRVLIAFLAVHIVLSAINLYGGHSAVPVVAVSAAEHIRFALLFVGGAFRGWPAVTLPAGVVMSVALLALALRSTYRAIYHRKREDVGVALLLALALIVAAEACGASYARASLGLAQATVPRYATPSVVMLACLLGAAWRLSPAVLWPRAAQLGLTLVAIVSLLGANASRNVVEWRFHTARLDRAGFAFANGMLPDALTDLVYAHREFRPLLLRLRDLGLGPFSPNVGIYNPPFAYISGVEAAALPACRFTLDVRTQLEPGIEQISGWVLAPEAPVRAEWLLAFDANDALVGSARLDVPRPDVAEAFKLKKTEGLGFDIVVRSSGSALPLKLVATLERARGGPRACLVAVPPAPGS